MYSTGSYATCHCLNTFLTILQCGHDDYVQHHNPVMMQCKPTMHSLIRTWPQLFTVYNFVGPLYQSPSLIRYMDTHGDRLG